MLQTIRRLRRVAVSTVVLMICAGLTGAVQPDQIDDFEDGTTMGWAEGAPSPNPPTNVASGGPAGADDNYLENVSAGGGGAGSRMVMFNTTQWSGDYTILGQTPIIHAHMANLGGIELYMRVALESVATGLTNWVSTDPVILPADAMWYLVSFVLSEDEMTPLGGSSPLATELAAVSEVRILSAVNPSWLGDSVAATLAVDNIRVDAVLFGDGFESSDDTAWDSSQP